MCQAMDSALEEINTNIKTPAELTLFGGGGRDKLTESLTRMGLMFHQRYFKGFQGSLREGVRGVSLAYD